MKPSTIQSKARLKRFLAEVMHPVGRRERQHWGEVYVRGLLSEGGRKTAATIAQKLPDGNIQALQQFVGQSPWDHIKVREQLAKSMIQAMSPKPVWIIDDTGFPKKGTNSVGVARQYSGTLGKVGNCQIAVSLNYATDDACIPLNFALYIPEEWANDPERLKQAGVPQDVTFKKKWQLALEMIDQAIEWNIPAGIVDADAGYGNNSGFRKGLAARKLTYFVGVDSATCAWTEAVDLSPPAHSGKGRPRRIREDTPKSQTLLEIALSVPDSSWHNIGWREGTKGTLKSRFTSLKIQPSHGYRTGEKPEGMLWMLVEWPADEKQPTKFWLSNLADETSLIEQVRIAKSRWWIEQNYQQLKDELGLDNYEGRYWLGWNHHVTLCMIAFGFLTLELLVNKKNYWVEYSESAPATEETPGHLDRNM
jgi:SRSO17 transposase